MAGGTVTSGTGASPATGAGAAQPWTAVGPPDAPAIVFVHGTRLSRAQWDAQLRRLRGRFRCVSLDLPGHGVRAGEPFTFEAAAAAVAEAIAAAVPSGRAVVVGLSLGGYVAIEAAGRYPDRVAGLVLAGCSAEPRGGPGAVMRTAALAFERVPRGVLEAANIAVFRVRYPRAIADPIIAGGFWWDGGTRALRALLARRFLDRLSRMWVPLLVVNGAFDFVFAPGGEAWADAARQGRSVVVPWAGHLVPMDRPATFAGLVAAFARSVAATPRSASAQDDRPEG